MGLKVGAWLNLVRVQLMMLGRKFDASERKTNGFESSRLSIVS